MLDYFQLEEVGFQSTMVLVLVTDYLWSILISETAAWMLYPYPVFESWVPNSRVQGDQLK